MLEQAEARALGHSEGPRALGVEPAGPVVLHQRVAERLGPVCGRVGPDPIAVQLHRVGRGQLDEANLVGQLAVDPAQVGHHPAETARAVDRQRHLPPAQRERLHHPRQPEDVVGVEVRQEDALDVRQADGAQQLPLRALTAVEQDAVAAAAQEQPGRGALDGRHRAGRAEEEDGQVHRRIFLDRAGT